MKSFYIYLFLAFILVLGGCTQNNEPLSSAISSSNSQDVSPKIDNNISNLESNDVVNLPNELYQVDQRASAKYLRYDFEVDEKTELAIVVEVTAGNFSLGIQDKDSSNYVYNMKEFDTETDSVTLDKGSYSLVVKKSEFTGNYGVKGAAIE